MAKNRYIQTRFWSDPFIQEMDNVNKLFYLYLLTNEHTSISGVYELSIKTMEFESGIPEKQIRKAMDSLSKTKKAYFFNNFVFITNFIKNQANNPKVKVLS